MYSHLPYFLYIAAILCCSKDEEYFDEDFFYACETPSHLPVARWCLFRCLVLSGLAITFVIRYDVINTGSAGTHNFWFSSNGNLFFLARRCSKELVSWISSNSKIPRISSEFLIKFYPKKLLWILIQIPFQI
jgi:hypothetical protein